MNAVQQAAPHELTLSEQSRLTKNVEQLGHVRQNLVELGFTQAAILVQRAIEAVEAG